jgi:uncharacterized peroxidase-related enzyme
MSIINPLSIEKAQGQVKDTLAAIKNKMGGKLPNFFAVTANSSAALQGYIGLTEAIGKGKLSAKQRELIAISVAAGNACDYCLAAHMAIGKWAGVDAGELTMAQSGKSTDPKTQAMLDLAAEINKSHGRGAGAAASKARTSGLTEEEILEVAANVALSVMTNSINGLAETDVDFPRVAMSSAA